MLSLYKIYLRVAFFSFFLCSLVAVLFRFVHECVPFFAVQQRPAIHCWQRLAVLAVLFIHSVYNFLILGTVLLSNHAASHAIHMKFHNLSSLLFFLHKSCLLGVYAPLCLIVQSVKCSDVRMRTEEKDDIYLSSSCSCAVQGA